MLKEISLKDFNGYSLSRKDGCYAGDAGFKDGILIDNEYWMIKYPKNTTGMRGEVPSYTSSPLSEFIGSHIYDILGYDVHETVLGFKNNKIVVGCKDFCGEDGLLKEIRSLKNSYNENLENYLKVHLSGTGSDRFVDLDELLIHFEFNPILLKVPNLKNRFWDCVIIDGLINNNDRNNGNWGLLNRNGKEILSPIFDNGACFYNKQTDYDLERKLMNEKSLTVSSLYVATAYKKNNKPLFFKDILNFTEENADLQSSIKRVVPLIKKIYHI